jgi:hypothetical protein
MPDGRAHRGELHLVVTEPALEDEAASRDRGERAHLLGDEHGIPQGQEEEAARRRVAPLGEEPPEDRDVLVVGGSIIQEAPSRGFSTSWRLVSEIPSLIGDAPAAGR